MLNHSTDPFYKHGFTSVPAWIISTYIHYKVYAEITKLPFSNFNGAAVGVWEWRSNFIPHFTGHVITYTCYIQSQRMLVKRDPALNYPRTTKQLIKHFFLSVYVSGRPSAHHTFFTMFPSSYRHEFFRSYYQRTDVMFMQKSRSGVKGQGHRSK